MYSFLGIQFSLRSGDFGTLVKYNDILEESFRADMTQEDRDRESWEHATKLTFPDELVKRKSLALGMDLYVAALVGALANGESIDTLLRVWRSTPVSDGSRLRIPRWVDKVIAMKSNPVEETVAIMRKASLEDDTRLVAASLVGSSHDVGPEALFYAHILLANRLLRGLWCADTEDYLADLVSTSWIRVCDNTALLYSPRVTVPAIEEACREPSKGSQKIAKILLAAHSAVYVRVPDPMINWLRHIADENGVSE
jgi:hypothetical protein